MASFSREYYHLAKTTNRIVRSKPIMNIRLGRCRSGSGKVPIGLRTVVRDLEKNLQKKFWFT